MKPPRSQDDQPERKRPRGEQISNSNSSRRSPSPRKEEQEEEELPIARSKRSRRSEAYDDVAAKIVRKPSRRKRKNPEDEDEQKGLIRDLIICGPIVLVSLCLLPLLFISPVFGILTSLAATGTYWFGFVLGCIRSSKLGSFVSFDYLESLGPLRWILAICFFGLYLSGYILLWTFTQIQIATGYPKKLLPCLGLQAYAFIYAIIVGLCTDMGEGRRMQRYRVDVPSPTVQVCQVEENPEPYESIPRYIHRGPLSIGGFTRSDSNANY